MLDTDILIMLRRQMLQAEEWLRSLIQAPAVCGFAASELLFGCQNDADLAQTQKFLAPFTILFPTPVGVAQSLNLAPLKLSHGLGSMDALVAATALEYNLPLYTWNAKHFGVVPGLQVIVPYVR